MSRSAFDSHGLIRQCAQALDPHQVKAKLYGYLRADLPGSSDGDHRGSSEPALVGSALHDLPKGFHGLGVEQQLKAMRQVTLFDPTDAELLAWRKHWDERLDQAATLLKELLDEQMDLLAPRKAPKPKSFIRAELRDELKGQLKNGDEEANDTKRAWLEDQLIRLGDSDDDEPVAQVRWCVSCARYKSNGVMHLSPVADEKRGGKDCVLCRWCLDVSRDTGEWPPMEWIEARAKGQRVRVRVKAKR